MKLQFEQFFITTSPAQSVCWQMYLGNAKTAYNLWMHVTMNDSTVSPIRISVQCLTDAWDTAAHSMLVQMRHQALFMLLKHTGDRLLCLPPGSICWGIERNITLRSWIWYKISPNPKTLLRSLTICTPSPWWYLYHSTKLWLKVLELQMYALSLAARLLLTWL